MQIYMDEHVSSAITEGLRRRGVDALTAREDLGEGADDEYLIDRATSLSRVLFTRDADFLRIASRRQRDGLHFTGIIYAHQLRVSISRCIEYPELIALTAEPSDLADIVQHLPLR